MKDNNLFILFSVHFIGCKRLLIDEVFQLLGHFRTTVFTHSYAHTHYYCICAYNMLWTV